MGRISGPRTIFLYPWGLYFVLELGAQHCIGFGLSVPDNTCIEFDIPVPFNTSRGVDLSVPALFCVEISGPFGS